MNKLTPREEEVLRVYLREGTVRDTAGVLNTSPTTVRKQRASVMRKLMVSTPLELTRAAIRRGLIEP